MKRYASRTIKEAFGGFLEMCEIKKWVGIVQILADLLKRKKRMTEKKKRKRKKKNFTLL